MKRKYVKCLMVIVVIIIGGLFICSKIMRPKSNDLPEVRLKEIINKDKSFAIMIQSKNGYKEYDSDTWPGSSYKFKEAKCIDNNGDEIKEAVTYEEGKITLTTNKTIYCTVYFDYKGTINILRENDPNKVLSTEEVGGMYRYQGVGAEEKTDDTHKLVDNNYICFGTDNKDECINDEEHYMYRIIGITKEGQLYLLKSIPIKEENIELFVWDEEWRIDDGIDMCPNRICSEWNDSDIYRRINGIANGTRTGTGNNNDNEINDSDIFVDSPEYEYLKSGDKGNGGEIASEWYNLIAEHSWMYGNTSDNTDNIYNGNTAYAIETGQLETSHYIQQPPGSTTVVAEKYKWPETNKVTARIGLMYIHDYMYAYPDGNPGNGENAKTSWIFFLNEEKNASVGYEWLITGYSTTPANANANAGANGINIDGRIVGNHYGLPRSVRPTFYLINTIKISGNGAKTNPYIINAEEI